MPKRVPDNEVIDPVRSRLAQAAAAAAAPRQPQQVTEAPLARQAEQGSESAELPRHRKPAKFVSRDRLTVHRKVMFAPDEADRNEETTKLIAQAFGNPASYSQITRAIWTVLAQAEDALKVSGKRSRHIPVPSTGDHIGMAEYENTLAEFLATALRRS